jgi:SNF2 family DNA or RNA helicase
MPQLADVKWLHVIADECHRMKNRRAKQTVALKKIPALWKTAMSGTPAVNRPDELWSVLNWLHPERYTSYWKFFNRYVSTETEFIGDRRFRKIIGPRDADRLRAEIKPFSVRRLKRDVLTDLPEKYNTEIRVTLTPQQRQAYDTMRDEMIAWIGDQTDDEVLPAPVIIAQLTRLLQFAVAYAEFDEHGKVRLSEPSSKLDACMEVLEEAGDKPVVVFSRFRSLIDLLAVRLEAAHLSHGVFTGNTDQADRDRIVNEFQAGDLQVFAGTIGAGGVGLTLHRASTVVFLDREWSPALNAQAEDRLHRLGQKNAVQVIDIIARNTIETRKLKVIDMKKAWLRRVLDGTTDSEDE